MSGSEFPCPDRGGGDRGGGLVILQFGTTERKEIGSSLPPLLASALVQRISLQVASPVTICTGKITPMPATRGAFQGMPGICTADESRCSGWRSSQVTRLQRPRSGSAKYRRVRISAFSAASSPPRRPKRDLERHFAPERLQARPSSLQPRAVGEPSNPTAQHDPSRPRDQATDRARQLPPAPGSPHRPGHGEPGSGPQRADAYLLRMRARHETPARRRPTGAPIGRFLAASESTGGLREPHR
jgi:hypothetical protein